VGNGLVRGVACESPAVRVDTPPNGFFDDVRCIQSELLPDIMDTNSVAHGNVDAEQANSPATSCGKCAFAPHCLNL